MNILEIIQLRTHEREKVLSLHNFEERLNQFKQSNKSQLIPRSVIIYKHRSIQTDLSVHVLYKDVMPEYPKPVFGLLTQVLLKDRGLVNYSVWKQD
jgi:hypothetical protein